MRDGGTPGDRIADDVTATKGDHLKSIFHKNVLIKLADPKNLQRRRHSLNTKVASEAEP